MRKPLPAAFPAFPIAHRALHDRSAGRPESKPAAIRTVAHAPYSGPVAVMSFNPAMIATMARSSPHRPRGLTAWGSDPAAGAPLPGATCDRLQKIPDYVATRASFISRDWHDLSRPRVAALAARGARVLCWTIRTPAEGAAARRCAAGITFAGYSAPLPA